MIKYIKYIYANALGHDSTLESHISKGKIVIESYYCGHLNGTFVFPCLVCDGTGMDTRKIELQGHDYIYYNQPCHDCCEV